VLEPDAMSDPAIERLVNEYATAAASCGYKRSSRQARKAVEGFVKNSVITTDERILGVVKLGRSRWVLTTESLFDEREGKYGRVFDLFDCSIALGRGVVSVVDGPDHRELTFSDGAEHVSPPATNQPASERARRFFDLATRAQSDFRQAEGFSESGQLDDAAADLELATAASPHAEPDVRRVRDKSRIAGPAPIDDQAELVPGETPLLAQQLVAVDGFTYADIRVDELCDNLDLIEAYEEHAGADLVVGTSWHPVVVDDASRNKASGVEVGFLFLLHRNETIDGDELLEHLRVFWIEGEPVEELEIAGSTVLLLDNPTRLNSRYTYTWTIDDVSGVIDGANREPIERWLTAYLEELPYDD